MNTEWNETLLQIVCIVISICYKSFNFCIYNHFNMFFHINSHLIKFSTISIASQLSEYNK